MPAISYSELKRQYELNGPQRTVRHLSEAIRTKALRPEDFSLTDLAEALVPNGRDWVRFITPGRKSSMDVINIMEGVVDTSSFSNITGQLVFSAFLDEYRSPDFMFSALVKEIPTNFPDGEKIPGVGGLGNVSEQVDEGQPYQQFGVSEDYIETPAPKKYGFIVPVTREAIAFDRTNLVLKRARDGGYYAGYRKEVAIIDTFIGKTASSDNTKYKWKGTSYAPYQLTTPWINQKASNELTDYTDIDNALQLFADMTDPNTSLPILVTPTHLFVEPVNTYAARRIVNSAEIRQGAVSATVPLTLSANPVDNYTIVASAVLAARHASTAGGDTSIATKTWYLGDPKRAFAYMVNWGLETMQAPPNSEAEFTSDIVARFKVSERGTPAVLDPRYMVKSLVA